MKNKNSICIYPLIAMGVGLFQEMIPIVFGQLGLFNTLEKPVRSMWKALPFSYYNKVFAKLASSLRSPFSRRICA